MAYTIGNRRHALFIHNWYSGLTHDARPLNPDVWRLLGQGGQRAAYLHIPTNVVYKVQHTDMWEDQGYCSESELKNARKLRTKRVRDNDGWWGAYVRIPKVSGFRMPTLPSGKTPLIIGMQYVEGIHRHINGEAGRELYSTGLNDLHYKNTVIDQAGSVWTIDMGCLMSDMY